MELLSGPLAGWCGVPIRYLGINPVQPTCNLNLYRSRRDLLAIDDYLPTIDDEHRDHVAASSRCPDGPNKRVVIPGPVVDPVPLDRLWPSPLQGTLKRGIDRHQYRSGCRVKRNHLRLLRLARSGRPAPSHYRGRTDRHCHRYHQQIFHRFQDSSSRQQ